MKKLLLGSATLTLFAISITLFQISCKKEVQAQTSNFILSPATTTALGGVIVGNGLSVTSNGTLSVTSGSNVQMNKIIYLKNFVSGMTEWSEVWTVNYDGSNEQKINIAIPAGLVIYGEVGPQISPDGQKIFLNLKNETTKKSYIYSCKIDGTNLLRIVDGLQAVGLTMGSAY